MIFEKKFDGQKKAKASFLSRLSLTEVQHETIVDDGAVQTNLDVMDEAEAVLRGLSLPKKEQINR